MSALAFSRAGAGPPLVLLHGIGQSGATWAPLIDRLSERFEVFSVDLPGFGSSTPLPGEREPSPAALARAVAGWFDSQGWTSVPVVGSSLGGWVALELAALGRASPVVALSPAGFWSDRDRTRARTMLRLLRRVAETLVPPARGTMSPRVERMLRPKVMRLLTHSLVVARPLRFPAEAVAEAFGALATAPGWSTTLATMAGLRYTPPTGGLDVPVTIAWGAKDRLLSASQRARARELLPGARVGLLPGCGHLPMWDDPDLVTRVVLAGTSAGPASAAG